MIEKIASELRLFANNHPIDIFQSFSDKGKLPDIRPYQREVPFQGLSIRITFTLSPLGLRKLYVLSMMDIGSPNRVLPENVVREIKSKFFTGESIELPDSPLHGPKVVRKFGQIQ